MKKKTLTFILIVSIVILTVKAFAYNNTFGNLADSTITQPLPSYVFVKQWGSMGNEDGKFGGVDFAEESTFRITYGAIESLKNSINKEKLKTVDSMRNRKFANFNELSDTLEKLKFNAEEIHMIAKASALKKVSDSLINGPISIAVDGVDNVYVADFYHARIQKFDCEGNFILKWGNCGKGDGQFLSIDGITVDLERYIYVLDFTNHRIQKFDSNGHFILKWGSEGTGEGQFDLASGITIDKEGYIYTIDNSDAHRRSITPPDLIGRLQKFDSNGHFIKQYFFSSQVISIATNSMGYIFLTTRHDSLTQCCVCMYKSLEGTYPENNLKNYYSDNLKIFHEDFKSSLRLTTDKKGNLFILDRASCVYKFDINGNLLTKWGAFGSGEGQFNRPEAIAVDSKGNVYVMDTGNYRIQKFAPKP